MSILYVKLSMPFSCTDTEFQRRPQRPGLHSHYGDGNFCFWKRGWKAIDLQCFLQEGGVSGVASLRKPESERPLWTILVLGMGSLEEGRL